MRLRFLLTPAILLMTKLTFAQVNMQTGAAEQSFPLINYADSKAGMSFGVGLAYSSGNGLYVNDVTSNVGTGFSLDAGGLIVRVQNGEPDDQKEWTNNKFWEYTNRDFAYVLKNYPNGYMYNTNVGKGCNAGLNYYPVFKKTAVYKELNVVASDMEQDKFIFRMNGREGVFVIGRDWKVTTLGDTRLKVSFTTSDMTAQGIRTTINQFVIITEDGIKYTFSDKSLSYLCRYKHSGRTQSGDWQPIAGNPDDGDKAVNRFWGYKIGMEERPLVVNSWFLSEVENTNNGQKITYNYEGISNDVIAAKLINHQRDLNNSGPVRWCCTNQDRIRNGRNWYNYLSNPYNADSYSWNTDLLDKLKPGPTSIMYNRSIIESKRITAIGLPNGGSINFLYSGIRRIDLPGENALTGIEYRLNGKLIRGYKLEYGYFFKNSIRPYSYNFSSFESKFARLCLLSLQKMGNGEDNATEPPYKFSYYTGSTQSNDDIVPARNYLSQDHWGYYNGSISGLPLAEDHDFLSDERNQYYKTVLPKYKNAKNGLAKNGLLRMITYPTGGTLEYTYEQNRPGSAILPAQYEQLAGGVSVIQTKLYDGENPDKTINRQYNYKNSQNQYTRWGDEAPNYTSFSITEYNERWFNKKFIYPGLTYPEMATSIDWGKVIGKALVSAAINMVFSAALKMLLAGTAALPIVNIIVFVVVVVKLIFDVTKTFEYHRYILSNVNNSLSNPLPAFNSSVEVRSNSPGGGSNGRTVFDFTAPADYPLITPRLEWPYIQSQRFAGWAYGLPKKVTVYDKDNKIVNESSNAYSYIVSKVANQENQSCKCATVNKRSYNAYGWDEYQKAYFTWGQEHWMVPRPYYIYTGRTDMSSVAEKSYINGTLYYQQNTSIITDPQTLLQKGTMVAKDVNSLIVKLSYYPSDFNIGGALDKLKQNNALHTPVSNETWLYTVKPGQSPAYTLEMLDANVTEFKTYTFGARQEVKPWRTYQLKTKQPIPSGIIGMHNPNILIRQPSFYKLQQEFTYDDDGNLVQLTKDENKSTFVNDYNNRYVTATVAGAAYADVAYTSFEADGKGGWTFGDMFIKITSALTGMKSFKLGFDPYWGSTSTITKTGLDAAKTYTITYWASSETSPVLINGQAGNLLYTSPDGWKLYQQEVSNAAQFSINGDAIIDELRLYPKGALMSTVAYKEGIGKMTECDANNRLLHYEYDALGRLKLIRDQNRNIIKTYEYNYKK